MRKSLEMAIMLIVAILTLSIMAGCGTADSKSTQDLNNMNSSFKETPTPTSIPSPTPFPTPTILPKEDDIQTMDTIDTENVTLAPTKVPSTLDGINTNDVLWVLTTSGTEYRYAQLAAFFGITPENAEILADAYYYYSNNDFNGCWYKPEVEEETIDDWIHEAANQLGYSYGDMINILIDGYSDGYLDAEVFWYDKDGYLDDSQYQGSDAEFFAYYADRDYEDDPAGLTDFDDSGYAEPDDAYFEPSYLPISSNGIKLEVGDKVVYTSDNVFYYGGTIKVIDGSTAKITWEMKGDLYSGPINLLTVTDKDPMSNAILNPCNIPSDDQWYDTDDLEKVDVSSK